MKKVEASLVAQLVKNLPVVQEIWFNPWVGKIPWRKAWKVMPIYYAENSHGLRSLAGYSPWGLKELDTTKQARKQASKKEIEHLFMYLLAIYMSSLQKCLFRSFAPFLIGLGFFLLFIYLFVVVCVCVYWISLAACIFWRLILCQLFNLLLFSPILKVVRILITLFIDVCFLFIKIRMVHLALTYTKDIFQELIIQFQSNALFSRQLYLGILCMASLFFLEH